MFKLIDNNLFSSLLEKAEKNPRKRSHFNLHDSYDEKVQRLCIALHKGTYIRPHHHPASNKWELITVLHGTVLELIFDKDGKVLNRFVLEPGALTSIEITPDTWHTVLPLSDEAVIMEIKEGPYTPATPEDFATWSPEEESDAAQTFLTWAEKAGPGDSFKQI